MISFEPFSVSSVDLVSFFRFSRISRAYRANNIITQQSRACLREDYPWTPPPPWDLKALSDARHLEFRVFDIGSRWWLSVITYCFHRCSFWTSPYGYGTRFSTEFFENWIRWKLWTSEQQIVKGIRISCYCNQYLNFVYNYKTCIKIITINVWPCCARLEMCG